MFRISKAQRALSRASNKSGNLRQGRCGRDSFCAHSLKAVIACVFQICALSAAETTIQGVGVGYYFDPAGGTIRAINGTPGAAYLSAPLVSGLSRGWLAPNGRSALVIRNGALVLIPDCGNPGTETVLTETAARGRVRRSSAASAASYSAGDLVAWSGDSTSAAVYSPDRKALLVFGGLPANPAAPAAIDTSAISDAIVSVHVSNNAQAVALTVNRGGSTSLYLIPASKSPTLISQVSDAGPVDFSSDGQSLFAVDNATKVIAKVAVSNQAILQTIPLSSLSQTPGAFTGLLASHDGTSLYLTQENVSNVCALSIKTGMTTFCSAVDFSPSGMEYLSGSLYLLYSTGEPGAPMLLDGSQGAVWFVPAVQN